MGSQCQHFHFLVQEVHCLLASHRLWATMHPLFSSSHGGLSLTFSVCFNVFPLLLPHHRKIIHDRKLLSQGSGTSSFRLRLLKLLMFLSFWRIKSLFLLPLAPWLLSFLALTHSHHGLCRIEAWIFLPLSVWRWWDTAVCECAYTHTWVSVRVRRRPWEAFLRCHLMLLLG